MTSRVRSLCLAVFACVGVAACVQVLSYDDYRERPVTPVDAAPVVADAADTAPVDGGPVVARVPPRPSGARTPSGMGRTLWLGAKHMYLGTTDTRGETSPIGWRDFGFDLDSICTSVDDSVKNIGTCRRHPEANQDVLADGNLCRDNNFGRHVVAILKVSSDGFERRINDGLLAGNSAWILRLDDLDDGPNDAYVPGSFYRATVQKDGSVKWDGNDVRSITSDTVNDRDLSKPKLAFPTGYVADNVWVSGDPDLGEIVLPFSGELRIPLRSTIVTLQLDADHNSGKRGTLGGAIPMTGIEAVIRPTAEASGFCPGTSLYDSLLRNLQRFPDVVIGAPGLQNETVQCDGMSLGIGFDVQSIRPVVNIADPSPPDPSKCTDAG